MLSAKFVKIATLEGYLFVIRATAYPVAALIHEALLKNI